MKFRPLHDRVLVRRLEEEEKTASGIIIPDAAKEKPMEGEIIAVGAGARDENGALQALDVKPGDRILFLGDAVDRGLTEALNKTDLLDATERERLDNIFLRDRRCVPVSALTGRGCNDLLGVIDDRLAVDRRTVELTVALDDGAALAWLYRRGHVLERFDDERSAHMRVGLDPADAARFARKFTEYSA